MLGRDLEIRVPRGPQGQAEWLGLTEELRRGRRQQTALQPQSTKPPSVICMLAKRRQDSTERADAFIFPLFSRASEPVPSFTLSAVFKVHNMQVDLCTGQRSLQTYWDLARDFYSLHKSVPFHFAPRISLSAPRCP